MTRDGQAFALPTLVPPTDDSGCSSLPTPAASLHRGYRNGDPNLMNVWELLPTPVADHSRGLPSKSTDYASLPNVAVALLPTPAVNDMGAGKTVDAWDEWTAKMQAKHGNGNGHGKSLAIEAARLTSDPTPPPSTGGNGC
jgi:DNA (cytosine-5)-methyltransferase 1